MATPDSTAISANPLIQLLELIRRARTAESADELAFLAVNETHAIAAYRQAVLWLTADGVLTLSGVVQPEANAPYVQWLNRVCRHLHESSDRQVIRTLTAADIPEKEAGEWSEWLPEYALWMPFTESSEQNDSGGGLLLAADAPWSESQCALLQEWRDAWHHAWRARYKPSPLSLKLLGTRLSRWLRHHPDQPWWKQPRLRLIAVIVITLLFPVRLTVLAPGELVPANPDVIRAPIDGVVGKFHVTPNETVKAGQPLLSFDEAPLRSRLDVASQSLATAETEYRQYAQQALSDAKFKPQLAMLLGKIEEKRAEADFLRDQLDRSRIVAPRDGIALFDDPTELIGKPVQTGERIMRIAAPGDVEIEAWLALGDAIPLPSKATVTLYLASSPLSAVPASLRYVAHDAVARPNGVFAYRVRARLDDVTHQRVGLKGTAKLSGRWVPLVYWVLRRPLATVRQTLGI